MSAFETAAGASRDQEARAASKALGETATERSARQHLPGVRSRRRSLRTASLIGQLPAKVIAEQALMPAAILAQRALSRYSVG